MNTESPFKDHPGFLTFEEFYLLPIGTPVETVNVKLGFTWQWKREKLAEDKKTLAMENGDSLSGGHFMGDAGLLPYYGGNWNDRNYTRLPLQKPQPPSELDKLRQELKAARDTVERLAVQIEEMSK